MDLPLKSLSAKHMAKALIVYAHPAHQRSRANQALLNSVKDLTDVTIHDLYEVYPNFFIDVPAEQALLEQYLSLIHI